MDAEQNVPEIHPPSLPVLLDLACEMRPDWDRWEPGHRAPPRPDWER